MPDQRLPVNPLRGCAVCTPWRNEAGSGSKTTRRCGRSSAYGWSDPSVATLHRVFKALDVEEFERSVDTVALVGSAELTY